MTEKKLFTAPDGTEWEVDADLMVGSSEPPKPIPFTVNGELYFAVASVPAEDYGRLTALLANMPRDEKDAEGMDPERASRVISSVMEMTEMVLMDESAERIAERMRDKARPVGITELLEAVTKLINRQYSKEEADSERPTKPTSD